MYDHFVGDVVETTGTTAVLRCGGVGFELRVPVGTASRLKPGDQARLFAILHVVDGAPTLLGFGSRSERDLARRILAVSGVGPTLALAILSTYDPATFGRMVVEGDAAALKRVKGVGGKTAERLCLELRDRVAELALLGSDVVPTRGPQPLPGPAVDAVAALVTLGYTEKDARQRVEKAVGNEPSAATEVLIKTVLRG